jgi:nucleotide-binding universal stress UspA family protein
MKILIATDGSDYGEAAVQAAAKRPWPQGSELRVLVVMERPAISYVTGGEYELALSYEQVAAEIRSSLESIAQNGARSVEGEGRIVSHIVREGVAAEEIIDEAKEWGADLILVGTHSRHGISRFLLGSVAQRVATHAPCSVEIVRKPG